MKTFGILLNTLALAMTGAAMSACAYANQFGSSSYKTRSVVVKFSDLNLSRTSGVDTLYRRLRTAGDEVCGPKYGAVTLNPLQDQEDWSRCYKDALDHAAAKVGNQQLSQMIYGKTAAPSIVAERD